MPVFFILMIGAILWTAPVFSQSNSIRPESKFANPQETYESILASKWLQEKKDLGKKLAVFQKDAHPYIARLLEDKNYWNRLSGLEAARLESSEEIRSKIFGLYEKDHMTRAQSQELITDQFLDYEERFLSLLHKTTEEAKRKELALIVPLQMPKATLEQFEKDVNGTNLSYKKVAFHALSTRMKHHPNPTELDSRLRSYLNEPGMKSLVLKHILRNGSSQDLDIFLKCLDANESSFTDQSTSLKAVKKWGSLDQEIYAFESILSHNPVDERLAFVGIQIFPDTRSAKIEKQLCFLAKQGKSQDLRLESATALVPYNNKNNLECLQKIADESLDPTPPPGIIEATAVVLTFGIAGFHKARMERNRRANFEAKQARIKNHIIHLQKE